MSQACPRVPPAPALSMAPILTATEVARSHRSSLSLGVPISQCMSCWDPPSSPEPLALQAGLSATGPAPQPSARPARSARAVLRRGQVQPHPLAAPGPPASRPQREPVGPTARGAQASARSAGVHRAGPAAACPRQSRAPRARPAPSAREPGAKLRAAAAAGGGGASRRGRGPGGGGAQVSGRPLPFALGGGRGSDCTISQWGGGPGRPSGGGADIPSSPRTRASGRASSATQCFQRPAARDREERPHPPLQASPALPCLWFPPTGGAGGTRKSARALPGRGARGSGGGCGGGGRA